MPIVYTPRVAPALASRLPCKPTSRIEAPRREQKGRLRRSVTDVEVGSENPRQGRSHPRMRQTDLLPA
jgi:hypothetical protein